MGLNFYLNKTDYKNKRAVNDMGFRIYAVRGNHEERPQNLGMKLIWDSDTSGMVYYEPEFPNIRYFMDGGLYVINKHTVLVIGGAYSVDKEYRLLRAGYTIGEAETANPKKCGWFKDEQLTKEERDRIASFVKGKHFGLVLTHTCPIQWEPTDLFLPSIDQTKVDKTMEYWLAGIESSISYNLWLCGHYHADRGIAPRAKMLYWGIEDLEDLIK